MGTWTIWSQTQYFVIKYTVQSKASPGEVLWLTTRQLEQLCHVFKIKLGHRSSAKTFAMFSQISFYVDIQAVGSEKRKAEKFFRSSSLFIQEKAYNK